MGLQSVPAYARALSHPEITLRNLNEALFGRKSGLARVGDFAVAPTATTRQFSVGAGAAFVNGQENAQQGGYFAWSDAADNLVVAAPSASPRIDTVLLRIYDEQYGTLPSGTSRAQWDIIQGVAAASPSARPDSDFKSGGSQYVPGAWFRLCDIRSNPGDTTIPAGQIYPTLEHTKIGNVLIGNRSANTTGFGGRDNANAYAVKGDRFYCLDSGLWYRWNGSKWLMEEITKARNSSIAAPSTALVNDDQLWAPIEPNSTYRFKINYEFTALATPKFNVALRWPNLGTNGRVDVTRFTNGSSGAPYVQYVPNLTGTDWGSTGYPDGGSWGVILLEGTIYTGSNATAGNFQVAISQFQSDPSASYGMPGSYMDFVQTA